MRIVFIDFVVGKGPFQRHYFAIVEGLWSLALALLWLVWDFRGFCGL